MPLPTTLDVLAEALAHRDTIRDAERQFVCGQDPPDVYLTLLTSTR